MGGLKSPSFIDTAHGLYNSLYYCTSRGSHHEIKFVYVCVSVSRVRMHERTHSSREKYEHLLDSVGVVVTAYNADSTGISEKIGYYTILAYSMPLRPTQPGHSSVA